MAPVSMRSLLAPLLALLVLAGPAASALAAQEEVLPELRGQVLLGETPVEDQLVILHRVSETDAGPVDSVATDTEGRFRFTLPRVPDPGSGTDVHFASTRYQGVLYFGPPVGTAVQLDSLYLIPVFPVEETPREGVTLPILVRTLAFEAEGEEWVVTDLFQTLNEGATTLAAPEGGITWSHPLPPGARDLEVGESDLSPETVRIEEGMLRVDAPMPPGAGVHLVRYRLSVGEPIEIPVPGRTDRLEVLVRQPSPPLRVEGLQFVEEVEVEAGGRYRRYAGSDLTGRRLRLLPEAEPTGAPLLPFKEIMIGLAVLLAFAGYGFIAARGRGGERGPAPESSGQAPATRGRTREELIARLARLDEEYAATGDPDEATTTTYRSRRKELLDRLASLGRR